MSEPNKVIDLGGGLLPSDTAELHIVKPGTNEPIGWVITMAGPSHPQSVSQSEKASRRYLHREAQIEQARANNRKWKGDDKQPAESRREFIESIVGRIVTWTPVRIGTIQYDFSPETAIELLSKPDMGLYVAQIVEFISDEKSFMTGSEKN